MSYKPIKVIINNHAENIGIKVDKGDDEVVVNISSKDISSDPRKETPEETIKRLVDSFYDKYERYPDILSVPKSVVHIDGNFLSGTLYSNGISLMENSHKIKFEARHAQPIVSDVSDNHEEGGIHYPDMVLATIQREVK